MLQKIQATRFEELIEKLKVIQTLLDSQPIHSGPSRLGPADRLALITEIERLTTQLELMHTEHSRPDDIQWRGSANIVLEAATSFDQSQVELTYLHLREQKISGEIWIAQSRGINTCWQIADRLNRTYRGHGYVTMQPHLTERDIRANREVAAAVTEEADRAMIDTAFAIAAVLNGMGGPERTWDHEWMSTSHRVEIITECFRLLRQVVESNVETASKHHSLSHVPRTTDEIFLM